MRKTAPFTAWLIAYVVIGGAVFLLADEIVRRAALGDLWAISVSVLLSVVLGWRAASWVQRIVASRGETADAPRPAA